MLYTSARFSRATPGRSGGSEYLQKDMAMKLIKKTAEYKIFMRGDDSYAVQDASGKPVNEEKVRILSKRI